MTWKNERVRHQMAAKGIRTNMDNECKYAARGTVRTFLDYDDDEEDYDRNDSRPALKLAGEDGNAFSILGRAGRVARKNNMDWKKIQIEATSGDYDHLLQTMMKYFNTY